MKQRRVKIPLSVLERAKAAVEQTTAKKPAPPAQPRVSTKQPLAREKVIAALKKLHPMD